MPAWLKLVTQLLVACWTVALIAVSGMHWNDVVWELTLSGLVAGYVLFLTLHYHGEEGPDPLESFASFLGGVFVGMLFSHGPLEAIAAVVIAFVASVVIWCVGIAVAGVIIEIKNPDTY